MAELVYRDDRPEVSSWPTSQRAFVSRAFTFFGETLQHVCRGEWLDASLALANAHGQAVKLRRYQREQERRAAERAKNSAGFSAAEARRL